MIDSQAAHYDNDLLLVLPVSLGQDDRGLLFESQACNGIECWLQNFSRIEVICPLLTGEHMRAAHSIIWKPVAEIDGIDRVTFQPLPYVTLLSDYSLVYRKYRSIVRQAISRSRYLSFVVGGQLFGNLGAVACREAQRLRRPYSVWTDAVQYKLCLVNSGNLLGRLKSRIRSQLVYWISKRCIENASLGLFHGASCYAEYQKWCPTAYVVHDVHAKSSDAISANALEQKCREIAVADELRIVYAGRADSIKGPFDWIEAMCRLREHGVAFRATWLGDGPLLDDMRRETVRRGMDGMISLPGFISNRNELLTQLRAAHAFVFCHKMPESPRNLIEGLITGCPIIGYRSDFAEELVRSGGGSFVDVGDVGGLAQRLVNLNADREQLVNMTLQAAGAGKRFNDVAVFQHRSELIKAHL